MPRRPRGSPWHFGNKFQPETLAVTRKFLEDAGCASVVAVGESLSTPLDIPPIDPFSYIRFHNGAHGTGLSDEELAFWAKRIGAEAEHDREIYVYFEKDCIQCLPVHSK